MNRPWHRRISNKQNDWIYGRLSWQELEIPLCAGQSFGWKFMTEPCWPLVMWMWLKDSACDAGEMSRSISVTFLCALWFCVYYIKLSKNIYIRVEIEKHITERESINYNPFDYIWFIYGLSIHIVHTRRNSKTPWSKNTPEIPLKNITMTR
jgi:hypothetical protein